jgi:hypothetical protein
VFVQGLLGGRDLRGARRRPLVLRAGTEVGGRPVTDKLVYEVHEYGFLPWYGNKYNFSADAYRSRLDGAWGWAARENVAPVWVGEFGTAHNADGVEKSEWFQAFTRCELRFEGLGRVFALENQPKKIIKKFTKKTSQQHPLTNFPLPKNKATSATSTSAFATGPWTARKGRAARLGPRSLMGCWRAIGRRGRMSRC